MCNSVHPFEIAGLGRAPFTLEGYSKEVGPRVLADGTQVGAPGQPMGTCAYCSRGIAHVFQIRSSDGVESGVGCDCVLKLDREDNKLVSAVKKAKLLLDRQARQLKAQEKARLAREKRVQARKDQEAAWEAKKVEIKAGNEWLISRLPLAGSPFIQDMKSQLECRPASQFSDRQLDILGRIWVESFGYPKNSQAEDEAADEFWGKVRGE